MKQLKRSEARSRGGVAPIFAACLILWLVSVSLSAPAQSKPETILFFEDFEAGHLRNWDDFDGNPEPGTKIVEVAGPKQKSGNHAVRLRAPAKERGGADLVKVLPQGHVRLYARWYVLYEPGFNFAAANHGSGLHAGDRKHLGRSGHRPQGNDWFCSWVEHTTDTKRHSAYTYYRGMYQDCADPNGRCWGDIFPAKSEGNFAGKPQHRPRVMPPELETGRWYCIELMLDGGVPTQTEVGANGILNYWIDGVEIGPWPDLWLRTSDRLKVSSLWLNLFHHDGKHSDEGILIDDVVISTERIGR